MQLSKCRRMLIFRHNSIADSATAWPFAFEPDRLLQGGRCDARPHCAHRGDPLCAHPPQMPCVAHSTTPALLLTTAIRERRVALQCRRRHSKEWAHASKSKAPRWWCKCALPPTSIPLARARACAQVARVHVRALACTYARAHMHTHVR